MHFFMVLNLFTTHSQFWFLNCGSPLRLPDQINLYGISLLLLGVISLVCNPLEGAIWWQVSSVQLRDDLLSMLVAGHETTGSVLTWTVYLLSKVWIECSFSSLYGKQAPGFQLILVDALKWGHSLWFTGITCEIMCNTSKLYTVEWCLVQRYECLKVISICLDQCDYDVRHIYQIKNKYPVKAFCTSLYLEGKFRYLVRDVFEDFWAFTRCETAVVYLEPICAHQGPWRAGEGSGRTEACICRRQGAEILDTLHQWINATLSTSTGT